MVYFLNDVEIVGFIFGEKELYLFIIVCKKLDF